MVAKGFPLMDIAQMHFYGGEGDSGDRIAHRYARMRIGTRIDQNALMMIQSSLNCVHQGTFVIRLKKSKLYL